MPVIRRCLWQVRGSVRMWGVGVGVDVIQGVDEIEKLGDLQVSF